MSTTIQTYTVIVHEAEEGGYWGEVLELAGCASQGETIEEFRRNIKEAIEAVLGAEGDGTRVEFHLEPTIAEKGILQFSLRKPYDKLFGLSETNETWTAAP